MPPTRDAARPKLLLSVFATFAVGGQQVRFTTMVNRLGAGWRHAIIAMDGNLACRDRLDSELDVAFPDLQLGKGAPVAQYLRLRRALHVLRPNLLLTHSWGSIEWAIANRLPRPKLPQVHAEDGFGPEEQTQQLHRRIWARRLALRQAAIILPSRTLFDIAERIWQLPPARLHHVPNGIDLSRFTAAPAAARREVVVGTVAALRAEKNLGLLIQAIGEIANDAVRLIIVGDGPERGRLEHLAQELLPGRVRFAGHMADPAPAYQSMDIFALSSNTEQMPLSLIEAMASGLPVAATDVGDVANMVADGNRSFITDAKHLATSLAKLISDAPLRRRLGEENREKATKCYDEKDMIKSWEKILQSQVKEGLLF